MQVWSVVISWRDYETNNPCCCSCLTVAMDEIAARNKASISFWNSHHPRDVKDLYMRTKVSAHYTDLFKTLLKGDVFDTTHLY